MTKLYGNLPVNLGVVGEDIDCSEMMYYLYLPVKVPGKTIEFVHDDRLEKFCPLLDAVYQDFNKRYNDRGKTYRSKYVYLTVKTLYVTPNSMGQRPCWHSDGFMTDDVNYIWYTKCPTQFFYHKGGFELPQDHEECIQKLNPLIKDIPSGGSIKFYPYRSLLRLDETVIHRTYNPLYEGKRTFVKISVSDHIYAHKGNSTNPAIDLGVEYKDRGISRNCPATHRRD